MWVCVPPNSTFSPVLSLNRQAEERGCAQADCVTFLPGWPGLEAGEGCTVIHGGARKLSQRLGAVVVGTVSTVDVQVM